ncbi:MAG: cysteine--tRNA ligase [Rhodobacteraceae bacterium]|nr:cysteine--tRNA ligase [Paracoccaceae bacterium]
MTDIKLYNTKTRTKENFVPIDPANVRMYVCGPTVYDRAHIGNARPVVVFDTLFRLLRHVYGHYAVRYVRNFTDVDDKINARAAEMKAKGDDRDLKAIIRELTDQTIAWYHEDMEALGTLRPTDEPRATEYIGQMVVMIEALIEKGHAYASEGHVLFDVNSYEAYGALSGRKLADMRAGERVEVEDYKRDPMDFVLWKPSTDDLPGWESPWGRGRPGWHIECSAMSLDLLGATFDIHGGGLDLQFPHHENEIAQSCCANPDGGFANVWMHNEMIQVEGKKMSKSLGNFFTVKDLLDKGIPGEVIRFVIMSTHYRSPMDWTEKRVKEATATLRSWVQIADRANLGASDKKVVEALADDLNTSKALQRLNELYGEDDRAGLTASAQLLGFDLNEMSKSDWATPYKYITPDGHVLEEGSDYMPTVGVQGWGAISDDTRVVAVNLVHVWLGLRRNSEWGEADALKMSALAAGIELQATRSDDGVNGGLAKLQSNLDISKLEARK